MSLEEEEVKSEEKRKPEITTLADILSGRREWLLLTVTLALLIVLGYTVREIFSPILVFVVFLVATYPLRHESIVRHLILVATLRAA